MTERIMTPEAVTPGHRARYLLAAGALDPGDVVIDAACGIGYGAEILDKHQDLDRYVGVDKDVSYCKPGRLGAHFHEADLREWRPDFQFDVVVSFETIEHISDYGLMIDWMTCARKWIIASVPVVPTVGINPWHVHNFESGELPKLFKGWEVFQVFGQPQELSEVYMLRRSE